jgi:hypothetical protein
VSATREEHDTKRDRESGGGTSRQDRMQSRDVIALEKGHLSNVAETRSPAEQIDAFARVLCLVRLARVSSRTLANLARPFKRVKSKRDHVRQVTRLSFLRLSTAKSSSATQRRAHYANCA